MKFSFLWFHRHPLLLKHSWIVFSNSYLYSKCTIIILCWVSQQIYAQNQYSKNVLVFLLSIFLVSLLHKPCRRFEWPTPIQSRRRLPKVLNLNTLQLGCHSLFKQTVHLIDCGCNIRKLQFDILFIIQIWSRGWKLQHKRSWKITTDLPRETRRYYWKKLFWI